MPNSMRDKILDLARKGYVKKKGAGEVQIGPGGKSRVEYLMRKYSQELEDEQNKTD